MQCDIRTLVYIYVVGGLTFVPLVVVAVVAFIWYTSPIVTTIPSVNTQEPEKSATPSSSGDDIKDEDELEGVDAHKVGWLQVSREYDSSIGLIGPEKIPGNQRGKYIDKVRSLLDRQEPSGPNNSGFLKVKQAMFYAVLKHGNLFLYETEEQVDVKHVIVLEHFLISIWPPHKEDDELFLKPNAICLSRKNTDNELLNPKPDTDDQPPSDPHPSKVNPPDHSYFLFPTTNIEKEDWYFALLRGAKSAPGSTKSLNPTDPTIAAVPARFEQQDMFSLIQTIHSSDAQLQTRWLNALIGRMFLATYGTKFLEERIMQKITKKIARVRRPAFLSDIKVHKVVVGTQAPVFTQPRLKELSAAGEFAMDVNVAYNGGLRIEIGTVATLQLGSRFKPRQVTLALAVTIKKLEGKLLVRMKKPPSNRLWLGFYEPPVMDLTIEPIVSSRQITYTMVLRAIESRIREAIEESVVLPNMDDTAFLPTTGEFYRGGIWQRKDDNPEHPEDPAATGDVEGVEKEMERAANGENDDKGDSAAKSDTIKDDTAAKGDAAKGEDNDDGESADSLDMLHPKRKLRTTLRTPTKETTIPKSISEYNLKSRISRSSSFTSTSSAPAVVATDPVNVSGTSPTRESVDWAAEAAARAIAQRAGLTDSPRPASDASDSRPVSIKSASSIEGSISSEKGEKNGDIVALSPEDRSASAPPAADYVDDHEEDTVTVSGMKRFSSYSSEKEAALSARVSQATGAAKDMLKTRLNTYLAKRQQSKLQKQILANDRDRLVNSVKPRTRFPSDNGTPNPDKPDEDDIDSGPLPYEPKKSPLFSTSEFSGMSSPAYRPSAMMTIPSTMANARRPSAEPIEPELSKSAPPTLPPRTPTIKRPVPAPPLPVRSSPRPIPRRPVPLVDTPQSAGSSAPTSSSPEDTKDSMRAKEHTDEEDLMILHISSDEEQSEDEKPHPKESGDSPAESPQERRKVLQEEEAVLEPSSYGSNRSRRGSEIKQGQPQWNEKETSDREMPELMMEQGLMG